MTRGWRLVKTKYVEHAMDGEGPRLFGSRWSSRGNRIVVASESLSLAVLEVLVQIQSPTLLDAYSYFELAWDDTLMEGIAVDTLPDDWRASPASPPLQRIGDGWLRSGRSTVLRVPSAVIPIEHNFLIKPSLPRFSAIRVEGPFALNSDPGLRGASRE